MKSFSKSALIVIAWMWLAVCSPAAQNPVNVLVNTNGTLRFPPNLFAANSNLLNAAVAASSGIGSATNALTTLNGLVGTNQTFSAGPAGNTDLTITSSGTNHAFSIAIRTNFANITISNNVNRALLTPTGALIDVSCDGPSVIYHTITQNVIFALVDPPASTVQERFIKVTVTGNGVNTVGFGFTGGTIVWMSTQLATPGNGAVVDYAFAIRGTTAYASVCCPPIAIAEVTDLQTALDGKQALGDYQPTFTTGAGVTNLDNVLSGNYTAGANITLTTNANGAVAIAGSSGGTAGTMINTGANVVGNVPRASDTSPTNYVPSLVIVDGSGNVSTPGTVTATGGFISLAAGGSALDSLQVTNKITNMVLTASRLVVSGTDQALASSTASTTEAGYLAGVTSAIQTQINTKQAAFTTGAGVTNQANVLSGNYTAGANITLTTNANGAVAIAGSSGGTAGTMINTGANVVGNVPRASDTSPTNYVPSLVIVDGSGNVSTPGTVTATGGFISLAAGGSAFDSIQVTNKTTNLVLTASRAVVTGTDKAFESSATTATEVGYLSGVTSAIQTQLGTKSPSASPTFTGTVTLPTPFTLGAVSVLPTGTELNFVDGVTSAIQTQIDTKAPLASPTFTGTTTFPTPFTLGAVSVLPTGTELNYVDGVTSSIQTQLDTAKISMIGIAIDGGGSAITTGEKGTPFTIPYSCTITGWTLTADQSGSIVIDIWKEADSYDGGGVMDNPPAVADTITASAKPTLSTQRGKTSTTLTGWTTSVTAGDTFIFNVDSSSTVTRANLILKVTK